MGASIDGAGSTGRNELRRWRLLLGAAVIGVAVNLWLVVFPESWRGCPWGTTQEGDVPPGEMAVRCVLRDGRLHGPYAGWHREGLPGTAGSYREGLKDGRWREWHGNGALAEEGEYRKNLKWGEWTYWWPTGGVASVGSYDENGLASGAWRRFHKNGAPTSEGSFLRGRLHGPYRYRYDNGDPWAEGVFDEHGRQGRWRAWHRGNAPALDVTMVDDSADGELVVRHPGGGVAQRGRYARGRRVDRWEAWDDRGNPTRVVPLKELAWLQDALDGMGGTLDEPEVRTKRKGFLYPPVVARDVAEQAWTLKGCLFQVNDRATLNASWTITPEGHVVDALARSTAPDPRTGDCARAVLSTWTFPEPFDRGAITVEWAFHVTPRLDLLAVRALPPHPVPLPGPGAMD